MLKQIVNQHLKEYQQTNASDDGLVDSISGKTGISPATVMQMIDPVKYADQITQAKLAEEYQNEQDRRAAEQAAAEAKARADALAEQARQAAEQERQAAEVAKAEALKQQQENINKIRDIFNTWMKAPVTHTAKSFYRYTQNSFGLDPAAVQDAVADQSWFIVK